MNEEERCTCEGCGQVVDSESALHYVLDEELDVEYQYCDECMINM